MVRSGQILYVSDNKIENFDWQSVVMREKNGEEIYLPSPKLRQWFIGRASVWIMNSFLDFELVKRIWSSGEKSVLNKNHETDWGH